MIQLSPVDFYGLAETAHFTGCQIRHPAISSSPAIIRDMENGPTFIKSLGISDQIVKRYLSGLLIDIANETSVETALAFAWKFGGQQVYMPKLGTRGGDIVELLGYDAAQVIIQRCTHGEGEKLAIPQGPFSRRNLDRFKALKMFADGATLDGVSNSLRVARSTAQALRQEYLAVLPEFQNEG